MRKIIFHPHAFFRSYQSGGATAFLGVLGYMTMGLAMLTNVRVHDEEPLTPSFAALAAVVSVFTLSAFFGFLIAFVGSRLLGGKVSFRRSLESVGLSFLPAGVLGVLLGVASHLSSGSPLAVEVLWFVFVGCCLWAFALAVVSVAANAGFGPGKSLLFVGWFIGIVAGLVALAWASA